MMRVKKESLRAAALYLSAMGAILCFVLILVTPLPAKTLTGVQVLLLLTCVAVSSTARGTRT